MEADAVVIGAGPNGLVAANLLADAGWDVLVLEADDEPGGAVKSSEFVAPGFVNDRFSSFYPLGVASPVLRRLDLPAHGLQWTHAPTVLAHPLPDGRAAVMCRDLDATVASVGAFDSRDAEKWRATVEQWNAIGDDLIATLMAPFPPLRAGAGLARRLGPHEALRFARFGLMTVRRYAQEAFHGEGAALLIAGNALHTDLGPEQAGSAIFGWLLAMLGQDVGYPVPVGGAGALTAAMVRRLASRGGRLHCGSPVDRVLVVDDRAVGVRVAGSTTVRARRAVLADVPAPSLFLGLLDPATVPPRMRADLRRFDWDDATVKVDWALAEAIPWKNPDVSGAGTVHLGGGLDALSTYSHELALGRVPAEPFLIVGQMSTADPTRSPAGTEAAWGYTHVPAKPGGAGWDDPDLQAQVIAGIEARMEEYAPGFRDIVTARQVSFPQDLEQADRSLVHGALNAGTSGLHQQLIFRPFPGLGRPETYIRNLYLASASAHPGGGVHGACGANAARAALRARGTGRIAAAAARAMAG
jgi:phytoene dehydrogenase-like protein